MVCDAFVEASLRMCGLRWICVTRTPSRRRLLREFTGHHAAPEDDQRLWQRVQFENVVASPGFGFAQARNRGELRVGASGDDKVIRREGEARCLPSGWFARRGSSPARGREKSARIPVGPRDTPETPPPYGACAPAGRGMSTLASGMVSPNRGAFLCQMQHLRRVDDGLRRHTPAQDTEPAQFFRRVNDRHPLARRAGGAGGGESGASSAREQ